LKRVGPKEPAWIGDLIDFVGKEFPNLDVFEVLERWVKTQSLSIADQLQNGIRLFDLRVVWDDLDNLFRAEHFLLAKQPLFQVLDDIHRFVDTNPKEIVVLMMSHFFGFDDNGRHHNQLLNHLDQLFAKTLMPTNYYLNK
jgi:hypothetical protein